MRVVVFRINTVVSITILLNITRRWLQTLMVGKRLTNHLHSDLILVFCMVPPYHRPCAIFRKEDEVGVGVGVGVGFGG